MIKNSTLYELRSSKNLLAFSAGVDSTALFFILFEKSIEFDIAIVDYGVRSQSKLEVDYAKNLSKIYNKRCFIKEVSIPKRGSFESQARDLRYKFFDEIVELNSYDTLITAHQLNDRFEWMIMQFTKGAGLVELLGMKEIGFRKNYRLIRPLLDISKSELEKFLIDNDINYFIDESNFDDKYHRNGFRKVLTPILDSYSRGIKRSFDYLDRDVNSLIKDSIEFQEMDLTILKRLDDDNINIRNIDLVLKKLGLLISSKSRNEIISKKDLVVSHRVCVVFSNNLIWISPYILKKMPKDIKNFYRINKIPSKVRGYIYSSNIKLNLR